MQNHQTKDSILGLCQGPVQVLVFLVFFSTRIWHSLTNPPATHLTSRLYYTMEIHKYRIYQEKRGKNTIPCADSGTPAHVARGTL